MNAKSTPLAKRCSILGTFWKEYREDEKFAGFFEFGDLGLPLAFAIAEGIVSTSPKAERYINELWDLFIAILEIEDSGFNDLDEMLK